MSIMRPFESSSIEQSERCPWCGSAPDYVAYHDQVWGRPVADGQELFEKLCLDGQQAGLSWITILRKQAHYREAYAGFDPERIARFDEQDIARLLQNPGIVRNRLKVKSIIGNARAYLDMADRGEDFARFLWSFVEGRPIIHNFVHPEQIPVTSPAAEAMSRALRQRGFSFVGPTICYAFMQAVGMVNDHLLNCPVRPETLALARDFRLKD